MEIKESGKKNKKRYKLGVSIPYPSDGYQRDNGDNFPETQSIKNCVFDASYIDIKNSGITTDSLRVNIGLNIGDDNKLDTDNDPSTLYYHNDQSNNVFGSSKRIRYNSDECSTRILRVPSLPPFNAKDLHLPISSLSGDEKTEDQELNSIVYKKYCDENLLEIEEQHHELHMDTHHFSEYLQTLQQGSEEMPIRMLVNKSRKKINNSTISSLYKSSLKIDADHTIGNSIADKVGPSNSNMDQMLLFRPPIEIITTKEGTENREEENEKEEEEMTPEEKEEGENKEEEEDEEEEGEIVQEPQDVMRKQNRKKKLRNNRYKW